MKKIKQLLNKLFGYKYYAVLINDNHKDYISSNIYSSHKYAKQREKELRVYCKSLHPNGIVSFRSRVELKPLDVEINK